MKMIARVERFVWYVIAGGIALVAGLWFLDFTTAWTLWWSVGLALAVLGTAGLAGGIASEIEY